MEKMWSARMTKPQQGLFREMLLLLSVLLVTMRPMKQLLYISDHKEENAAFYVPHFFTFSHTKMSKTQQQCQMGSSSFLYAAISIFCCF